MAKQVSPFLLEVEAAEFLRLLGALNGLSLCSGIAGLDLGLRLAMGERYRTVCHVERDAFAAALLVARMEDATLDCAPVWSDLETFRGREWRGVVDFVSAGFPCQPWSGAGKKLGVKDARWIWPEIDRVIGEVEPSFVFLENVPGLLRHGLREVLSDLAARGFDAEWASVRASEIGAPHRRERLFILAWRVSDALRDLVRNFTERGEGAPRPADPGDAELRDVGAPADGAGIARAVDEGQSRHRPRASDARGPRQDVADPDRVGPGPRIVQRSGEADEGRSRSAACRRGKAVAGAQQGWEGSFPPGPGDADGWRRWLAGGGPEPAVRVCPDGLPSRVDELRALGNAVVPGQAGIAFMILWRRMVEALAP